MPLQATSGAASYDAFGGGVAAVPNYIEDVFSTYLIKPSADYTTYSINNGIDLSTKGGMTWFKARDAAQNNLVYDTARGSSSGSPNALITNSTAAQQTAYFDYVTPNTNGFTVNYLSGGGQLTNSGINYVSWTFRKQPKFFDVVTYTGDNTARTIAHDLGSVPGCIIIKRTDSAASWWVYHTSLGATKQLVLNSTSAQETTINWNNTSPTSTVFSLGGGAGLQDSNINGATYVAYLFANDAGGFGLSGTDNVISCGSIELDGSSYSTVNLGYEPQWVLTKNATSTSSGGWEICDNMRGMPATSGENYLLANSSAAEGTGGYNLVRPTSTGFSANSSAGTYIYIAIRRGPMKVPTSGTSVYKGLTRTGTGATATVTGVGFSPDLIFNMCRNTAGNYITVRDRLRGTGSGGLATNQGAGEPDFAASLSSINMDGITYNSSGIDNDSGFTFVNQFFRRAPSFFDEVCYTGTGANTTFAHNLGAVPELMLVKRRNTGGAWDSYSSALANTEYIVLNTTAAKATGTTRWNSTTPTSSVFSVGTSTTVNASGGTYVAYLFATCAGVSKVGSYTGTATTKQIDCGFTGGARFVVIKRTDSTGDWYVWDSARGIVSGDDPYLLFNSTAEEVTNTDYIDTYSAGFEISSTAPAAINANGGSFIFLAIA